MEQVCFRRPAWTRPEGLLIADAGASFATPAEISCGHVAEEVSLLHTWFLPVPRNVIHELEGLQ